MWIFLVVVILVIGFIVMFSRGAGKTKKRYKSLGGLHLWGLEHQQGLPLAKDVLVTFMVCPDKVVMDAKKSSFEVPNERIISYDVKQKAQHLIFNYYDRNNVQKSITFESKMWDLNLLAQQATKALNRPEDVPVISENGSITL
ncbi:hypothetical protein B1748_03380 [Paenibacillus sp. MY03]|uniref:hypothetical protein n=1 Tax=Paenibacillus sp. MY03 TaxID=302980 RepID=UPI000B3D434D|nr:hypothetical protein [Paenibacillus sp. MY03]OUS77831.1 hypothetical protein B1748_03380 [Paenibacillus sp. MY03]